MQDTACPWLGTWFDFWGEGSLKREHLGRVLGNLGMDMTQGGTVDGLIIGF